MITNRGSCGLCSCGSHYLGEAKHNAKVRWNDKNDIT